jgi:prefoldin subunit 5
MDSVERAIGIWRQLAEDLNDQITEQKQEFDQQIDLLKQQIADLQKENKRLHDIISKLQGAA